MNYIPAVFGCKQSAYENNHIYTRGVIRSGVEKNNGADHKTLWYFQLQFAYRVHRNTGSSALCQLLGTGQVRQGVENKTATKLYGIPDSGDPEEEV